MRPTDKGRIACFDNMRTSDAKSYWNVLKNGDDVYVYGRKPGT